LFDISFTELALCFVVALLVLGPERLPTVARTVGRWTGQAKAYMRNLTSELERETQVVEIRKQIQEAQQALRDTQDSVGQSARQLIDGVRDEVQPPPAKPPGDAQP
jgi:sec-independent protein translocase protein TatB